VTIWRDPRKLILASQSSARQALLHNAGLPFDAIPADIDERAAQISSGLTEPGRIAALLARAKAADISSRHPGRVVIGADQTLALGPRLFNKPNGREQAFTQLRDLAGRTHELHAAIAVLRDSEVLFADVSIARMTMRPLGDDAINAYLDAAGNKVTTSVGCYQLEGLGVHLFDRIAGDHFTILGLPLLPLLGYFRQAGLTAI
jgi:septum formation protein